MNTHNNKEEIKRLEEEINLEKKELGTIEKLEEIEREKLHLLEKELEDALEDNCEEVFLIVNGEKKAWNEKEIDLQQVIVLAYDTYHSDWTNTVAYEDGPKQNPEGSIVGNEKVVVKNKMIFHATATFNS